jgi:hypothetical protein
MAKNPQEFSRLCGMSEPRITYTPRREVSPEVELDVLAAVYRYVLIGSQTRRGGSRDLTNSATAEMEKNGPRTTRQENT